MKSGASDWILFKSFANRNAADILCAQLELEGVASRIEAHDVEAEFHVLVPADLVHRARWITSQLAPTDSELEFLATGVLPDTKPQE
jgi:hypothetical protein